MPPKKARASNAVLNELGMLAPEPDYNFIGGMTSSPSHIESPMHHTPPSRSPNPTTKKHPRRATPPQPIPRGPPTIEGHTIRGRVREMEAMDVDVPVPVVPVKRASNTRSWKATAGQQPKSKAAKSTSHPNLAAMAVDPIDPPTNNRASFPATVGPGAHSKSSASIPQLLTEPMLVDEPAPSMASDNTSPATAAQKPIPVFFEHEERNKYAIARIFEWPLEKRRVKLMLATGAFTSEKYKASEMRRVQRDQEVSVIAGAKPPGFYRILGWEFECREPYIRVQDAQGGEQNVTLLDGRYMLQ